MSREGIRGGTVVSLEEAQRLFSDFRAVDYGWLRLRILRLAETHGEYHADLLADLELNQPNLIGAAVNALAKMGLIEKLNRFGAVEHRKSTSPASHGRASYVWRLTRRGWSTMVALKGLDLPRPGAQASLFEAGR